MQDPAYAHASCHCGQVRLRFQGAPESVVHCHCTQCRRLSGCAFTTWVSVAREGLAIEGESSLQDYAATANVTRHFCRHCGTHVHTSDRRYPAITGIPAGVLDPRLDVRPQGHYYVSDQAPWCEANDGLPRYGGPSGFERQP